MRPRGGPGATPARASAGAWEGWQPRPSAGVSGSKPKPALQERHIREPAMVGPPEEAARDAEAEARGQAQVHAGSGVSE
eukprot:5300184-Lingulodinium_polyedra.AAC.1